MSKRKDKKKKKRKKEDKKFRGPAKEQYSSSQREWRKGRGEIHLIHCSKEFYLSEFKKLSLVKSLIYARYCSKRLTQINLLNPHNNLVRLLLISSERMEVKVLVTQSCPTL